MTVCKFEKQNQILSSYFMTYLQGFFFVPPRAPCRAFKNQVMKSTASPAGHKTVDMGSFVKDQIFTVCYICPITKYELMRVVLPCLVIWKFFLLQSTTACSISCGDTWALKFLGFQSLRMSSPNLCTKRNMISPGGLRIPL